MSMISNTGRKRYQAQATAYRGRMMRQRGDPGLFSGILRTVGGALGGLVTGGPLGAVAGGLAGSGLLGGSSGPGSTGGSMPGAGFVAPPPQLPKPGSILSLPFRATGAAGREVARTFFPQEEQQAGTQLACPPGFRANKADYFLRDGTYVAKGAKCVRIRRRNPLNPRALSRALSRTESAKKAVKRLKIAPAPRRRR